MDWIIEQPDSVISSIDVLKTSLQIDNTFPLPQIVHHPTHHDTIRTDLTRQLSNLTEDLVDEVEAAVAEGWGRDAGSWNEICVFETVMQMVARVSNRVFVGKPLCKSKHPAFVSSLIR